MTLMRDHQVAEFRADSFATRGGGAKVGRRKHNHKLLASIATDKIFGANTAKEQRSRFAQDCVSSIVPVRVIKFLEVIQIEHEDAQRLLGAHGAPDFPLEHFL